MSHSKFYGTSAMRHNKRIKESATGTIKILRRRDNSSEAFAFSPEDIYIVT